MADKKYDLSEFAPASSNQSYDLNEFAPQNQLDPSIIKRIPGAVEQIGSDIWDVGKSIPGALINTMQKVPGYVDYLKKNIPEAGSLIKNNPALAAKSAAAGGLDLLGDISRIPPGIADYLAHIGMIKPETAAAMPRPFSKEEVENFGDKLVGEAQPGSELIRGTVKNIPSLYGAGEVAAVLNPLKFTAKNLAKDVVETGEKQSKTHSKMYNKIWDEADKTGFNSVPYDSNVLTPYRDLIDKSYPAKSTKTLNEFMSNPTLENAQRAQSDIGNLRRSIEEKARTTPLLGSEKDLYEALSGAEKHIEGNMFKDASGNINQALKDKYNAVSKSYRENVVPYKYNADIQAYKNKELLAKELIDRLKRGEFAAKKGSAHPRISIRDTLQTYGIPASFGAGYLLKKLLGESNNNQ